jgi:hypothetical protein
VRGTPLSLWRQYLQYGYWKVRVMQKHPRQIRVRQLVPPALVAGLIGSAAAACAAPGAVLVWGAIPGLYACATLTASIAAARRAGWPALLLLPMTFGILHTAYGLGFLAGLVRFAPRWRDSRARRADRLAGEDVRS